MFKIPIIPFYKIERAVRMLPIIKEVFKPAPTESESDSLKLVKKLKDNIHNKNAEIFTLRQKVKDLEENLENCKYQLNILNNAINNNGG